MDNLAELIHRARAAMNLPERETAVEQIVVLLSARLESYLLRRYYKPDIVEDLLQETFIKIVQNLNQCQANSDVEALSWCYTIARRTLADYLRQAKPAESLEALSAEEVMKLVDASSQNRPISAAEMADLKQVMLLLDSSKAGCRKLLLQRYIAGMRLTEMAEAEGITVDAMRMRVNSCLKEALGLFGEDT